MDLTPYLEGLRRDLAASAAPAGEAAARSADLLATALESSARLCLLEALSDAAAEITTKLRNGSVDVRLRGRDIDLVVSEDVPVEPVMPPMTEGGDVARITLRLPEPFKEHVERVAADEGVSVNAWLVRAVSSALASRSGGWPGPGWPGPGSPGPGGPPSDGGWPDPGGWPGSGGPGPGGPGAGAPTAAPRGRRAGRRMTGFAQA